MIVYKADSIDLISQAHFSETTGSVTRRVQGLGTRLEHDRLLDEWVSSLTSVAAVGQISQVILLGFILSDTALVWYITAHFDKFGTKAKVLLVYLCSGQLVLGNGQGASLVITNTGRFFLK